jgi:nucleoside-diphosphate-sugar epimerase
MKVAVLGGLGYIGSYVTTLLVNEGHDVTILDCAFFGHSHLDDILNKPNCTFIQGDIRRVDDLARVLKGAECVIHLAGLVGDPACKLNEEQTWLYNVESSNLITDLCNYYNVKRLIFASSCSVYGAAPSDVLLNTGSYLNPVSLYAESKIQSETIFFEKVKNECIILRLSTVFGYSPRMRFDLVANLFTIKSLKEHKIQVYGGTAFRPFIHCIDAARAFVLIANYQGKRNINRQIFNVNVDNISIRDLGELVKNIVPDCLLELIEDKEDERNYKVSGQKIRWLLGFYPNYSLSGGIEVMVKTIEKYGFEDWNINKNKYVNGDNFQCQLEGEAK